MESGSGSTVAPLMKFKEWQIGRSAQGTDKNDTEDLSFITSTQVLCSFKASVGYFGGSQPPNTSPIDPSTGTWTVIDASHNMVLDTKSVKKNWSGKHPSKLDVSTSFNVVGSLTVPKVVGTRTVRNKDGTTKQVPDYIGSTSCSHSEDVDRLKRTPVHREGKKMTFTIKFNAQTKSGQDVEVELSLKADDKDQIRQEYVDYNKPISERNDSKWAGENTYDFGHYKTMMDVKLAKKKTKWVAEINKLKSKTVDEFSADDFVVTSGYRNPHHNFDHSGSTALLSSHMYGYALDVRGKTDAKGNTLDIDGDGQNTNKDRK